MNWIILVADDDPSLRFLVTETLSEGSRRLLQASDGLEALDLARRELPDLILLDVAMPGMTGVEVCEALKADTRTRHIPVVMLTAKDKPQDRERGLAAGAEAYLTKPFSPLQLLHLVEDLLLEHERAWSGPDGLPGRVA